MKKVKRIAGIFLSVLAIGILGGCTAESGETREGNTVAVSSSEDGGGEDVFRVCFVHASTIGDNENTDAIINQLREIAASDASFQVDVLESPNLSGDWENNYTAAAIGGYDLIMSLTPQSAETMAAVAEKYPDARFVSIDNAIVGHGNINNVMCNVNESFYPAGVVAAVVTTMADLPRINEDKKVGFVAGKDTPFALDCLAGFEQGVHSVDPGIEVVTSFGDTFSDPVVLKEYSIAQINDGVDILAAIAGSAQLGAFEGCDQNGAYGIANGMNYDSKYPGTMLTGAVRNYWPAVKRVLEDTRNGVWNGDSLYLSTFGNGGMQLTDMSYWREYVGEALSDEEFQKILDAAQSAMNQIEAGEVVVNQYPGFRQYSSDYKTFR